MSERIDVLAVMDAVIEGMGGPTDLGLSGARAAVAELVEAAKVTLAEPWEIERLVAALARIAPNELHDMAAELRGRGE